MKTIIITASIIASILVALSFIPPQDNLKPASLGEIKYSVLNEQQFQEVNGTAWILLDGRSIAGTALGRLIPKLPDARGMFVRGMNTNNDLKTDPDGFRKDFQVQADITGKLNLSGKVTHEGSQVKHVKTATSNADSDRLNIPTGQNTPNYTELGVEIKCDNCGSETRPKNIPLYIYIKVN